MLKILGGRSKFLLLLQGVLACAVLLSSAVPTGALDLANTARVRAVAYEEVRPVFFSWTTPVASKSLLLTPVCEVTPPCQVNTVVPSFAGQPLNLAVNAETGFGYVTLIDGTLWKVNLNSNAPVTPAMIPTDQNLGIPTQIVLAPEINSAYIGSRIGQLLAGRSLHRPNIADCRKLGIFSLKRWPRRRRPHARLCPPFQSCHNQRDQNRHPQTDPNSWQPW